MYVGKPSGSTYHYDIYNPFFYFFTMQIFLWDMRKYASVTVRHIPRAPTPLIYWPVCPQGRPE